MSIGQEFYRDLDIGIISQSARCTILPSVPDLAVRTDYHIPCYYGAVWGRYIYVYSYSAPVLVICELQVFEKPGGWFTALGELPKWVLNSWVWCPKCPICSIICVGTIGWHRNSNTKIMVLHLSEKMIWWRNQVETCWAILALCAGNSSVTGEFPTQRPVTRRFDVFFDLRLNKQLSKQSLGWWFETSSRPLWRHCNEIPRKLIWWARQVWWNPHPKLRPTVKPLV